MIYGMKDYPAFILAMYSKRCLCLENVEFVPGSFTSQHCRSDIIYVNQMRKQVEKVKIVCLESYNKWWSQVWLLGPLTQNYVLFFVAQYGMYFFFFFGS